ncbi:cytochrome P450 [Auriscalpium vulgare]|uniref:Cytochrome P450 n=1 Tax=Auriscalpium vulgare TaxID=40419 RepID=A0ACB8RKA4_9AGAM|nr:cytochrome P450 [Auriscalpium vulgare]
MASLYWRFITYGFTASLFPPLLIALYFLRNKVRQWRLRKIRGPPPESFLAGNMRQLYNPWDGIKFINNVTKTYGRVAKIASSFGEPRFLISDPKACTSILLKDQDSFEETLWFYAVNNSVFGPGLLGTMGSHHRKQRKLLNPVFSIKHMRSMLPIFSSITNQLREVLKAKVAEGSQELDLVEWFGRLALELVSQGGMGYTFNSLDPHDNANEFGHAIKEYSITLSSLVVFRNLYPPLVNTFSSKFLKYAASWVPLESLHRIIHQTEVMYVNSKAVFDEKKTLLGKGDEATVNQIGEGKDIISVLLKANTAALAEDRMPDEEILAQMTTLLFAGTDTTSSALARVFDFLAQHQDVQDRLREELLSYSEAELGYDELVSLPYLDAVCRESLRLFPPVPLITRSSLVDVSIPLDSPITTADGTLISTLFVPKGTDVVINILGVNRDPAIWGRDAEEWKPERWLAPLPESVEAARIPGVYSNTLTFLGGARACIGFKFSQLEMKVVLSQLIRTFRVRQSKSSEVVWRMGGILTPSVKGSTTISPTMPMSLEKI